MQLTVNSEYVIHPSMFRSDSVKMFISGGSTSSDQEETDVSTERWRNRHRYHSKLAELLAPLWKLLRANIGKR